MKILVTGSAGLIGSEVCRFFHQQGAHLHGVDNNQRAVFFGLQGDTLWKRKGRFNEGGCVTEFSAVQKGLNPAVNFFIRALFYHGFNDTIIAYTLYCRTVIEGIRPILSPPPIALAG
jgi:dTDP-4-dehydrorhamnose reductase